MRFHNIYVGKLVINESNHSPAAPVFQNALYIVKHDRFVLNAVSKF
jgi:hypothetical protein